MSVALVGILYGFSTLAAVDLKVLHERAPLYVRLSDGSIQNKYTLKILNKMPEELPIRISVTGPEGLTLMGADEAVVAPPGGVTATVVFVKVPRKSVDREQQPILFHAEAIRPSGVTVSTERESVFIGPRP
jgi:polyferredoxin